MKDKHSCKCSRVAFSLIEMLVVIAIILILLRLLMPSLSGARKRALAAVCVSNLRQLGYAFRLYNQDYNFYPGIANDSCNLQHTDWVRQTHSGGCPSGQSNSLPLHCSPRTSSNPAKRSALGIYANPSDKPCKETVYWCPTDSNKNSNWQVSYTMNANISNPTDYSGFSGLIKEDSVKYTAETYLLFEDRLGSGSDDGAKGCGTNPVSPNHFNGAHSLFCDGHVRWNKSGPNSAPPTGTLNYDIANCRGYYPKQTPSQFPTTKY